MRSSLRFHVWDLLYTKFCYHPLPTLRPLRRKVGQICPVPREPHDLCTKRRKGTEQTAERRRNDVNDGGGETVESRMGNVRSGD